MIATNLDVFLWWLFDMDGIDYIMAVLSIVIHGQAVEYARKSI